jgi:hypothetical protein
MLITGLPVLIITHYLSTKVANAVQKAANRLVVAIVRMRVIMNPARPVVHEMRGHDQYYCERQEPILEVVPYLFGYQEHNAPVKHQHGPFAVMMAAVTVPQGVCADCEGEKDHKVFKSHIINQLDAENGQCAQDERQDRTMNRTGHRSRDSHCIPVDSAFHPANIGIKQLQLQQSCKNENIRRSNIVPLSNEKEISLLYGVLYRFDGGVLFRVESDYPRVWR